MSKKVSKRWPSWSARWVAGLLMFPCATSTCLAQSQGITIEEAIETTRFMTDRENHGVFVSPGGTRYAVMLITGDVEHDGVWAEIRVGALSSLRAAQPASIVRLFTRGLGGGYVKKFGGDDLTAQGNAPVWIDEETLAFLWEDAAGVRQVFGVNVKEGRARALTHQPTDVMSFSVGPAGRMTFNAADSPDLAAAERRHREGYAVTYDDATQLLNGGVRGAWDWMINERFVLDRLQGTPRRVDFAGDGAIGRYRPSEDAVWSADGRQFVISHSVSDIPPAWGLYTHDYLRMQWNARRSDPNPDAIYARQYQRLFVVDVASAHGRALWDVPVDVLGRTQIAWSADGKRVAVAPTVLPVSIDDEDARSGRAAAVIHVETGTMERLPVSGTLAPSIRSLVWTGPDEIEASLKDGKRLRWTRKASRWAPATHIYERRPESSVAAAIRVEIREALNTPPTLWAQDRGTGRAMQVFDPNPGLQPRRLGEVKWVSERRADGSPWEGRLYYPLNYRPGKAYPLVMQTYAYTPRDQFSLYGHQGPSLGPGRSAYIAQALASHDMFVLHGPSRGVSIEEVTQVLSDLETQIEKLVAQGLVDRTRIGIMGFSSTGWFTSVALTRGRIAYAAAITDDNKDGSYLQTALSGWSYGAGEQLIGAPPFGEGLMRWLEYSPAMNAERIRTPLLITRTSPGLPLEGWEMFSRLRFLRKPVEYYFIPDVDHGSHGLQNPRQLRALQGRALDWWRFWLKDERDPDPAKRAQYEAWDALREMHLKSSS